MLKQLPKLPDLLPYPDIAEFDSLPEINDKFVYVIKAYQLCGITVLIYMKDGNVFIRSGDFDGKIINPTNSNVILSDLVRKFINNYSGKIINLMSAVNISQAIYYIINDNGVLRLVDLRTSINKFAGPGMVRDLYSKIIDTQEIIKTVRLTPDIIQAIKNGSGNFAGDLILKSSAFKTVTRGKSPNLKMLPMYALVKRCKK